MLRERTVTGLHCYLEDKILTHIVKHGMCAIDLGSGTGALAERLQRLGLKVQATDADTDQYRGSVPCKQVDFNAPNFAKTLGIGEFDLVTSTEVIEHLENPVGFLKNIKQLLAPGGIAVITSPNVDNLAGRFKFLMTDRLWMVSKYTPEHIMPIFYDLMVNHWIPRAGLTLIEHRVYPPGRLLAEDFLYYRPWLYRLVRGISAVIPSMRICDWGNTNIFTLK